jgi:3-methylcrotonyl-CoA carboxylase alpha subunit
VSTGPIRTLLIANRGEIAVRIMRTARAMGMRTVAVHSDPDAGAMHVREADLAVSLGGTTSAESYLQVDRIIAAAKAAGADAIHPGYGFLSEKAELAEACDAAGIILVGPPVHAIRSMGDKITAKSIMEQANVPCVPGWTGAADESLDEVVAAADAVGYPVMIKAAAGGGGKGMRVVHESAAVAAAAESARREAGAAFGDARIFLERFVARARHIEFQVFADTHGNVVHLFERECSIQRRHQKLVEEAPSVALDPALRARMGEAAVAAARAIDYVGAGTIEFMLAADGSFFFLEMNTRLQVEHPVTELTTGQDLVRLQLMVAQGERLPFTQADLEQHGHSIECRLYAEDPAHNFMPSTGRLHVYDPPEAPGVRVDTGVAAGDEVTPYYDPMLAKLIVQGVDRDDAIARMRAALENFPVLGVTTNVAFLDALMAHPAFAAGDLHTGFLEEHEVRVAGDDGDDDDDTAALIPTEVLLAAALCREGRLGLRAGAGVGGGGAASGGDGDGDGAMPEPWTAAGGWRNT